MDEPVAPRVRTRHHLGTIVRRTGSARSSTFCRNLPHRALQGGTTSLTRVGQSGTRVGQSGDGVTRDPPAGLRGGRE